MGLHKFIPTSEQVVYETRESADMLFNLLHKSIDMFEVARAAGKLTTHHTADVRLVFKTILTAVNNPEFLAAGLEARIAGFALKHMITSTIDLCSSALYGRHLKDCNLAEIYSWCIGPDYSDLQLIIDQLAIFGLSLNVPTALQPFPVSLEGLFTSSSVRGQIIRKLVTDNSALANNPHMLLNYTVSDLASLKMGEMMRENIIPELARRGCFLRDALCDPITREPLITTFNQPVIQIPFELQLAAIPVENR